MGRSGNRTGGNDSCASASTWGGASASSWAGASAALRCGVPFTVGAGHGMVSGRAPARQLRKREKGGKAMSDHVYKIIELAGSSTTSIEDAIQAAVAKAAKTLQNLRLFEVVETRGQIEDGNVAHFQVTIRVGFTLQD